MKCPHCGGAINSRAGEPLAAIRAWVSERTIDFDTSVVIRMLMANDVSCSRKQAYNALAFMVRHGELKKAGYSRFAKPATPSNTGLR